MSPTTVVFKGPVTRPGEVVMREGGRGLLELSELSDVSSVGTEKISGPLSGPSAAASLVVSPPGVELEEESVSLSGENFVTIVGTGNDQFVNMNVLEGKGIPFPRPVYKFSKAEIWDWSKPLGTVPTEDMAILENTAGHGQTVAIKEQGHNEKESEDSPENPEGALPGDLSEYIKGKGVDPKDWGNVLFDTEIVDPEVQMGILRSLQEQRDREFAEHFAARGNTEKDKEALVRDFLKNQLDEAKAGLRWLKDLPKNPRDTPHVRKPSKSRSEHVKFNRALSEPLVEMVDKVVGGTRGTNGKSSGKDKSSAKKKDALHPVDQVTSDSALGKAFERLGNDGDPSDDSSSSDSSSDSDDETESTHSESSGTSSSSSSSSASSSSGSESDSESEGDRRHHGHHGLHQG